MQVFLGKFQLIDCEMQYFIGIFVCKSMNYGKSYLSSEKKQT